MMKKLLLVSVLAVSPVAHSHAQESGWQLDRQWLTEAEMKKVSHMARGQPVVLSSLKCRFADVPDPERSDVRFLPEFKEIQSPTPWGWTYEANAPNPAAEQPAKNAGFEVISEDFFEVTGVTWVRCKVWQRP